MIIKIDKNVDIPLLERGRYPWAEMEIGDSFFIEGASQQQLSSSAHGWSLRRGAKIKFRTKKEKNGARIWRIK